MGTQDVEARAWRKQVNREVKKGRKRPALAKGRYGLMITRDKKYIEQEMRMKTVEAKRDWEDVKKEFQKTRDKLMREARDEKTRNELKREMKRLNKSNERQFLKGREVHASRIEQVRRKVRNRSHINSETQAREDL